MYLSMNTAIGNAGGGMPGSRPPSRWTVLIQGAMRLLRCTGSAHAAADGATLHRPSRRWTVVRAQSVCVNSPRGQRVACEAGTLWLTFDGEPRDVVLEAGEHHVCDTDARLIVHALSSGAFRLE